MSSPLVRAAFVALLLATAAAFVVTQQLKGEPPLVLRFSAAPSDISPNGDRFRDAAAVGFDLSEDATVSFVITDAEGKEVRRLVDERRLGGDIKHRYEWDGRDASGKRVPDGAYTLRVIRRDEGRVINSLKEITVDTKRPPVSLVSARPNVISPQERGARVRIRYRGPRNEAPELRVFRTDDGPPRVVARFRGRDDRSATWYGTLRGRKARDGDYAFTVTVRDKAGNRGVAPTDIPTPGTARAGTGVAVRHLTLRGPVSAVAAGSVARLRVGPYPRRFRFTLSRLGGRRPVRRGAGRGGALRVRIPPRARTGVYLVRVRAGRRRAVWPLAVAGRPRFGRASRRPRPLVVLPVLTWQAENRFDDDLDGFADTLEGARSVRVARPFAGGRPPGGLRSQADPLLRFLDRERLPYDLTTDLALAGREGPALGRAPGVAFAGSARWLTPGLERRLRRYVEGGGRFVSFGADAFRRRVELRRDELFRTGPPRPVNMFGERTATSRTTNAPLVVQDDELGLFDGLDGPVGAFTLFERVDAAPPALRRLVAAGREPGRPVFVGYRLGKGIVVRVGTSQWARELEEQPANGELPRVTMRLWRLLARR
jgi:FlgD Ig-like domain